MDNKNIEWLDTEGKPFAKWDGKRWRNVNYDNENNTDEERWLHEMERRLMEEEEEEELMENGKRWLHEMERRLEEELMENGEEN